MDHVWVICILQRFLFLKCSFRLPLSAVDVSVHPLAVCHANSIKVSNWLWWKYGKEDFFPLSPLHPFCLQPGLLKNRRKWKNKAKRAREEEKKIEVRKEREKKRMEESESLRSANGEDEVLWLENAKWMSGRWGRGEEREGSREGDGGRQQWGGGGREGVIVSGALEVSNFSFLSILCSHESLPFFSSLSYFLQTSEAFCRSTHSSQAPACCRRLLLTGRLERRNQQRREEKKVKEGMVKEGRHCCTTCSLFETLKEVGRGQKRWRDLQFLLSLCSVSYEGDSVECVYMPMHVCVCETCNWSQTCCWCEGLNKAMSVGCDRSIENCMCPPQKDHNSNTHLFTPTESYRVGIFWQSSYKVRYLLSKQC